MTSSRARTSLLALALLALVSCPATRPAPASPAGDPYAYTPPPAGAVPTGLDAATWQAHLESDLLPYWTMAAAQGTPVGNFPTYRGMDFLR